MNCQFCGKENPDGALFCNQCGKRLNLQCPACGRALPGDARFCNYCGTPVAASSDNRPVRRAAAAAPSGKPSAAKRVLGYAADGCAMLGALISFIFVFLIGAVLRANTNIPGMETPLGTSAHTLYDYFGNIYREIESTLAAAVSYPGYFPTSMYVPAIFGTVAAGLALAVTAVLFILTLVRYVRNLCGRTQKSAGGLAVATFFSFLAGALLFLSVESGRASITALQSGTRVEGSVAAVLNGATIAGICVGAVCLAGYLGCRLVSEGRKTLSPKNLLYLSLCGVQIVLTVIVFAFLAQGCAQISINQTESGQSLDVTMTMGFSILFQVVGSYTGNMKDGLLPAEYEADFNFIMGFSIAGCVLMIIFVVLAALLLIRLCNSAAGRRKPTFALSIVTAVFAVVIAIFSAIAMDRAVQLGNDAFGLKPPEVLRTTLTMTILVAIFAVLFAGVALAISLTGTVPPSEKRRYVPYAEEQAPACPQPLPQMQQAAPVSRPLPQETDAAPSVAQNVPAETPPQEPPAEPTQQNTP